MVFLQVLLNEVAPRPHNSGHYTIEASYCSQYEQHLRVVLGLPLGLSAMKVPVAIMYNLLGEDDVCSIFSYMVFQWVHRKHSFLLQSTKVVLSIIFCFNSATRRIVWFIYFCFVRVIFVRGMQYCCPLQCMFFLSFCVLCLG